MIHRVAKVQAGQTALVTGAGGGVGTAMLQLLQLAGVKIYGAASARKRALVARLGATPIDYQAGPIDRLIRAHEPTGVDFAFDAIGGTNIAKCLRAVRRGGMVVGYGFMAADGALPKARMFFDLFFGARLCGRRSRLYSISPLYLKDAKAFYHYLPKTIAPGSA